MDYMTWEEYYEKIWEREPSTMVQHMSKLSSFGPSEEVMEAIVEISFGDQEGATRMLKKAVDAGVKFNGDQLSNMSGNCDAIELERALRISADQFTIQDIEDLYGAYEDKLLIEIALKYNIAVPEELAEENEELLNPNTKTPITWERFYNNYYNWSEKYARERFGALTSYGNEEELTEVISCLFGDDEASASKYMRKDDAWRIFEQQKTDAEKWSKDELRDAYEYVLQCLSNAHEKMVLAYRLSISDMGSEKRAISIVKHACLLEAEPYVDEARATLEAIESQVQDKLRVQNTRLNMGKWIMFHDVYGDGFFTNLMVQKRIKKMIQAVENAHNEVLKLKSKL